MYTLLMDGLMCNVSPTNTFCMSLESYHFHFKLGGLNIGNKHTFQWLMGLMTVYSYPLLPTR